MPISDSDAEASHPCTWEGCGRKYKRPEHLLRHQKTHLDNAGYICNVCGKQYSRSDILTRHLARAHDQSTSRLGRPQKVICFSCIRVHAKCDGYPPNTCSRCTEMHLPCEYRVDRHPSTRSQSPIRPSEGVRQPILHPVEQIQTGFPLDSTSSDPFMFSQHDGHGQGFGMGVGLGNDTSENYLNPFASSAAPGSNDFLDLFFAGDSSGDTFQYGSMDTVYPAISTTFDWGFNDPFGEIHSRQPPPPVPQPLGTPATVNSVATARNSDLVQALTVEGTTDTSDLPDGQPRGNIWPNVYVPESPESPVALPVTRPASPGHTAVGSSSKVPVSARSSMVTLATYAHRNVWREPNLGNFPSTNTLSICVDRFLSNFAPWLPMLNEASNQPDINRCAPILLQAMAAVGSVYGDENLKQVGLSLNELVRREIVYTCEHDRSFMYEPCIIQTSVLHAFYSLYSGSPKLFQEAESCRSTLVTACRRMNLVHTRYSAVSELRKRKPDPDEQELDRARRQDYRKLHLGWAILLLDTQLACFFGISGQFFLPFIHAPFPTIPSVESNTAPLFSDAIATLFDTGVFPADLSDFGLSCLAYSLYRICLEAAEMVYFSRQPHSNLTVPIFPMYRYHPQVLLSDLAKHILRSSSSYMPLRISCVALSYHSHLWFGGIGLMDKVKVAAGKTGDAERCADARAFFRTWMRENPDSARETFAYAVMLWSLMNRFTFDSPPEVVWLFDATVWIWAYLSFSGVPFVVLDPSSPPLLLGWAPPDWLDQWISSGIGEISVQGLRSGITIALPSLLAGSSDRLAVMSWGLAVKYREVVEGLLRECA